MIVLYFILSCWYIISSNGTTRIGNDEKSNNPAASFMWGAATAAYQIEGGSNTGGKGPTIWDEFDSIPSKIANGDQADIADDSYHKYFDDIALLQKMGLKYYRMSIAWARIFPVGKGKINTEGLTHYKRVFQALSNAGIEPVVTLYHWDLPAALEHEYNGWLSPQIEEDFVNYANVCFSNFGKYVKFWATVNEPWTFAFMGYGLGLFAPGRCSDRSRCQFGDSSIESYLVGHNVLNAHAAVVELYRTQYQTEQHGKIGIVLNLDWGEPLTSQAGDIAAARRHNEFGLAWFADPIYFGTYPQSMIDLVGDRLPKFTEEQRLRLIGSIDFLGLNHYSSKYYAAAVAVGKEAADANEGKNWGTDQNIVEFKYGADGELIGPQAASSWLNVVPWGFYNVLMWVTNRYSTTGGINPWIIVTENGCDVPDESKLPFPDVLHDSFRISYYSQYLHQLNRAMEHGANVTGYFAWSLMDNFEWADGYNFRFGLHYVNYSDPDRKRFPKDSASWYGKYADSHADILNSSNKFANMFSSWWSLLLAAFGNQCELPVPVSSFTP